MEANWLTIIEFTFHEEGGEILSLDPADPGNWTSGVQGLGTLAGSRFGVSAPVLMQQKHLAEADVPAAMASLTKQDAEAIYRQEYWLLVQGPRLPGGLDLSVFDAAANMGVEASARLLQHTLVHMGHANLTVDGLLGSETLGACQMEETPRLIAELSIAQLDAYLVLAKWPRYGRGWSGRVGRRLSASQALAS